MKKTLALVLTVLLFALVPMTAMADFDPSSISTAHVLLMDADTGTVLYEYGGYTTAYPASTTKIMTAILAIENCDVSSEIVTVGEHEAEGSRLRVEDGEMMPLMDMLYGMMLISGNDCAKAIAEHVAGTVDDFAVMMNEKAVALGMTGTHYVNPHGLPNDDHYTTAYDMALLARYAMQNETFRTIVSTPTYHIEATNMDRNGYDLTNTNKLLRSDSDFYYPDCIGIKTGTTVSAGYCFVGAAERDGRTLILVLMGDWQDQVSTDYRFRNAVKMFDWGFENYAEMPFSELGVPTTVDVSVANASFDDPMGGILTLNAAIPADQLIVGTTARIAELREGAGSISMVHTVNQTLVAPIEEGTVLGTVIYSYAGQVLLTADLTASRTVAEIAAVTETETPSPSPLIIGSTNVPSIDGEPGPTWVFWALVAVAVLAIVIVIRIIVLKKNRGRTRRSKRGYRR